MNRCGKGYQVGATQRLGSLGTIWIALREAASAADQSGRTRNRGLFPQEPLGGHFARVPGWSFDLVSKGHAVFRVCLGHGTVRAGRASCILQYAGKSNNVA